MVTGRPACGETTCQSPGLVGIRFPGRVPPQSRACQEAIGVDRFLTGAARIGSFSNSNRRWWFRFVLPALAMLIVIGAVSTPVAAQSTIDRLPYRKHPVDYFGPEENNVSRLFERVRTGEVTLESDPRHGYLPAVLRALDVPAESQLLVFAKNAANARLISPQNPRALYFSDDISIGWTPGAAAIEISVIDLKKGPVFYALRFREDGSARLTRDDNCLTCHVSENTLQVPGFALRSFLTDAAGKPVSGYSSIDHTTPYPKRWGGWYVTGDASGFGHMGNLATADALSKFEKGQLRVPFVDLAGTTPVAKHLRATSDVLPMLVHDHQMRFYTLLTRLRYEAAFEKPLATLDPFLRCLLFADEPPLPAAIVGDLHYRKWFESAGKSPGENALREFELRTRLFRHRCSWLVDSAAFRSISEPLHQKIRGRLREILEAEVPPQGFEWLTGDDRTQLLELLSPRFRDVGEP